MSDHRYFLALCLENLVGLANEMTDLYDFLTQQLENAGMAACMQK